MIRPSIAFAKTLAALVALAWLLGAPPAQAAADREAKPGKAREHDYSDALKAVVNLKVKVSPGARSAERLGTERTGSGVLIDDQGLILTIGYLVMEAREIEITTQDGKVLPGRLAGYDGDTGCGLVRAAMPMKATPVPLGDSTALKSEAQVLVISAAGSWPAMPALVADRRPFAGSWEYYVDNAIFTAPAHPAFGGAALIAEDGRLVGIGSLYVGDVLEMAERNPAGVIPGNMFVPIDDLKPILADLLAQGKRATPPRPWIGVYTGELRGRVFVTRLAPGGPAEKAGLLPGDIIVGVNGKRVGSLIDLQRRLGGLGGAGVEVPLDVLSTHGATASEDEPLIRRIRVPSIDRQRWLIEDKGL